MCCAVALRFYYFDAAPAVVQTSEPLTKILVAKRTIPRGIAISADSVIFQEVAISEVPVGSLTSFAQVYRRQSAYPIPVGCPICEDLLQPLTATATQAAFMPLGSQFVTLDIVHVRQGEKVFSPKEPLSPVLVADQRVDIRVVPRNEVQGKLAERKNEVLRAYASQDLRDRESGELLLENVPIHQVQGQSDAHPTGSLKVFLILDKSEANKLTTAAKKGQLRIFVHQEPAATAPPSVEVADVSDVADSSEQTMLISLPFEPLPIDVPAVSDLMPSMSVESDPATTPIETAQKILPEPKTADIFDSVLPPAPIPDFALPFQQANEISQVLNQESDSPAESSVTEVVVQEKIRNDAPKIAFSMPALRIVSEQTTTALTSSLPTNASGQESSPHFYTETVSEVSHSLQSLQFHSPGKITPKRESLQSATKQTEMIATPTDISALTSIPRFIQEKIQGYSPFERRIHNISSNDVSESPNELLVPPRLLRSDDSGTQIQ